jgi:hypothetical protein
MEEAMRKATLWLVEFEKGGPFNHPYYVEAVSLSQAVERAETIFDGAYPEAEGNGRVVKAKKWGEVWVENPAEDF